MTSICRISIEEELDALEQKGNFLKIPTTGKELRFIPTTSVL